MRELFEKNGYISVSNDEFADVYVINTCTVTSMSDKKSRQFIRKAKRINDGSIICVAGCYSQISPEQVGKIEGVNLIIGTNNRKNIVNLIQNLNANEKMSIVEDIMEIKDFEELTIDDLKDRTRAFLKIQEGCNQYCSYCIIPYARGKIRSRELENVTREVKRLADNGFKEIVLTGIHIASYGKDKKEYSLIDAIEKSAKIEGIQRIRVSSVEPRVITDELLERLSLVKEFCPHFHLSLQSGSDTVLKRMNRKYNTEEYFNAVNKIKEYFPDAAVTTDVIVGFPGETDAEFDETVKFVKKISFYEIHVFKYSKRKGTVAAEMKNQVREEIKDERSSILISISKEMEKNFIEGFIGSTVDVLFETREKDGRYLGHTSNYLKVLVNSNENIVGKIKNVRIIDCEDSSISGIII
jgi:threonylcarbamoyladenosine tRNA methylthiotransferase MtaB